MKSPFEFRDFLPHPRAQVAVHREFEQTEMASHRHEFIEIVFILAGHGQHVTGEIRHLVRPGDVFVINDRRSHGYEETRGLHLVNILVREDALREARQELGALPGFHSLFTLESVRWRQRDFIARLHLTTQEMRKVEAWIDALENEAQLDVDGGRLLARSWLILIVGFLSRSYTNRPLLPGEPDGRLAQLLSRIERKPGETYRLSAMARETAMSERSFLRHFKNATGYPPSDYVIRARIRQAAHLIEHIEKHLTITEIALRCGFNDSNYFARQFRRLMGTSPSMYLRRTNSQRRGSIAQQLY